MEKRKRVSAWVWIGSTLIALLILGAAGLGAYRLYALGWARGAAAVGEGTLEDTPTVSKMPAMPMVRYHGYRMRRTPILPLFLGVIAFGALMRHLFLWRRPSRWSHRYGPGPWAWHHNHPGHPDCPPEPEADDEGVEA